MGWNYALDIANDNYEKAPGFINLSSVPDDFENLVEVLEKQQNYDFKMMGDTKKDGLLF